MLKQLFLAAAMTFAVAATAQQQAAAVVEQKAVNETAELLSVAGQLAKYGYQTKTAMPLIQAAEICNRLGVHAATEPADKSAQSDGALAIEPQDKPEGFVLDAAKLLQDAESFADGDKNILALIKSTAGTRGASNGPIRRTDRVLAHYTDTWTINFRGGESAWVYVSGDGDTDLDLYVYDENMNLIDSDTDSTDECLCTFNPRWSGKFYIKIKNLGGVYNRYTLTTN